VKNVDRVERTGAKLIRGTQCQRTDRGTLSESSVSSPVTEGIHLEKSYLNGSSGSFPVGGRSGEKVLGLGTSGGRRV